MASEVAGLQVHVTTPGACYYTWYARVKKDKDTDFILSLKSNGAYTSKSKPLDDAFLHSIELSGYRIEMKINSNLLTVEQSNYKTQIVNPQIVYDLDGKKFY